jgi:hypothetical protein
MGRNEIRAIGAIFYLQQVLLANVQQLAEEMLPIAALRLFQEAAQRQKLTIEKVRQLAASLRRAVTDQLPWPADFPPSRPAG